MTLLSTAEVSAMTGIPANTLRYYRSIDRGPKSGKLGPRRVVYRKADVEAWIEAQLFNTARGDDLDPVA